MSTDRTASMHPDWAAVMAPLNDRLEAIRHELTQRMSAGEQILPEPQNVLRVLRTAPSDARVLVIGQDPYPTPGHAIGLSFAVDTDVRPIPRSLQNIYAELASDLGIPPAPHGDLSAWQDQGVMLLNRTLTVSAGKSASHHGLWDEITGRVVQHLAELHANQRQPLVAILWGNQARSAQGLLQAAGVPWVASPHPSPLSASRGFFGSKPFSRTNELLRQQDADEIDWRVVR